MTDLVQTIIQGSVHEFTETDGTTALEGIKIHVEPTDWDSDDRLLLPRSIEETSDENGDFEFSAWPNARGNRSTQYRVAIIDPVGRVRLARFRITVPESASPVNLRDIISDDPPPPLSEATQAEQAAQQFASDAQDSALLAEQTVQSAIGDIESARDSAILTIGDREDTAVSAVNTARDQGIQAVEDARDQGVGAVETARDDAVNTINGLVTQAETARDEAQGFRDAILSLLEERTTPIDVTGTSIDLSQDGIYYRLTVDGNVTLTFDSPSANINSFTLQVDHVSGEITWPASVVWPFDTPPLYADGNKHLFMFVSDDGGATYRGAALVDYPS